MTCIFTNELTTTPLFANNESSIIAELAQLERAVVASGGAATSPVQAYATALEQLFTAHSAEALQNTLGTDGYQRAQEYRLIAQTNSVGLIPTLGLIDDMMHTSLYILQTTKIKLDFMFLARSYFAATLLFNNSTLVTNPINLYVDESQPELKKFNLTSYTDILNTYTLDELRAVISY